MLNLMPSPPVSPRRARRFIETFAALSVYEAPSPPRGKAERRNDIDGSAPMISQMIAAIIGLIGTIFVASLGFHQWKRTHVVSRSNILTEERRKCYADVWAELERINTELRKGGWKNGRIAEIITSFNIFFLANSLYLDDEDQGLFNRYILSLEEVRLAVYRSDNPDGVACWLWTWIAVPKSVSDEIEEAFLKANELREAVKAKCQSASMKEWSSTGRAERAVSNTR